MTFIQEDIIWRINHLNRVRISKKQFNCNICKKYFKPGSRYFGGFHRWNEKQCISCFLELFKTNINGTKTLFAELIAHLKSEKMKAEKNEGRAMDMMVELGRWDAK